MAPVKRGPAVAGKHYKMGAAFSLCVLVSLCVLSQTENVKDYSDSLLCLAKRGMETALRSSRGAGARAGAVDSTAYMYCLY